MSDGTPGEGNETERGTDGARPISNRLLGDDRYEVQMTNDELSKAIAAAWDMQHRTGRISHCHDAVMSHLEALLKVQQTRAALVRLKAPND